MHFQVATVEKLMKYNMNTQIFVHCRSNVTKEKPIVYITKVVG